MVDRFGKFVYAVHGKEHWVVVGCEDYERIFCIPFGEKPAIVFKQLFYSVISLPYKMIQQSCVIGLSQDLVRTF